MLGNSYSTEQSTNSSDLTRGRDELLDRTLGAPPSPMDTSGEGNLADAGGLVGSGCFWLAAGGCFLATFELGPVFTLPISLL